MPNKGISVNVQELESLIIDTPDFPIPGVVFKDIFPVLRDKLPELMQMFKELDRKAHV